MERGIRDKNGRFFNPWLGHGAARYLGLVKWMFFSRNKWAGEKKKPVSFEVVKPDFTALDKTGKDYIVWLGHSTVIIKTNNRTIITDPVFWNVTRWVKRKTPLPIDPAKLPQIDYCLISHSHYDHLNTDSVKFLKERFDPVFICGPGYDGYFKPLGITRFIELNWWEEHEADGLKITSLPVQHWSKRTLFDTNKRLWASYLIESRGVKYYWIGDTGYCEGFKEIGKKFSPVDVLLVPIGAYEPRWFMKANHVNPEEALMIARDVRAKTVIPIHWGTFDLTDEPLWMPIEHLKEIHDPKKDPELKILPHGGNYIVEK